MTKLLLIIAGVLYLGNATMNYLPKYNEAISQEKKIREERRVASEAEFCSKIKIHSVKLLNKDIPDGLKVVEYSDRLGQPQTVYSNHNFCNV